MDNSRAAFRSLRSDRCFGSFAKGLVISQSAPLHLGSGADSFSIQILCCFVTRTDKRSKNLYARGLGLMVCFGSRSGRVPNALSIAFITEASSFTPDAFTFSLT